MSAHDQLVTAATRRAHEIMALPVEEREDRYAGMKTEHLATAGALGLPDDAVQELADQMERTIRRLVAIMEGGE
ncbi:hypothetical protein [Brevundimonas lenta]|uniref:Uncharacterized protein n=1 Tax=Brevundimonas lenta TaxID=424796 RepID=A0A7W6JBA9_9CAUL|nr:hypothetical protein [Brevundimonas lenta]MBB4081954.1 hypothetical protein [Brevundimonas lenta]